MIIFNFLLQAFFSERKLFYLPLETNIYILLLLNDFFKSLKIQNVLICFCKNEIFTQQVSVHSSII